MMDPVSVSISILASIATGGAVFGVMRSQVADARTDIAELKEEVKRLAQTRATRTELDSKASKEALDHLSQLLSRIERDLREGFSLLTDEVRALRSERTNPGL